LALAPGHKGSAPDGYMEYVMCTQLYHCTPSQLMEQDAETVEFHYFMHNEETKLKNRLQQIEADKAKAKKK